MPNFSYGNEFDVNENEPVGETHFHYEWFHMETRYGFDIEAKGFVGNGPLEPTFRFPDEISRLPQQNVYGTN